MACTIEYTPPPYMIRYGAQNHTSTTRCWYVNEFLLLCLPVMFPFVMKSAADWPRKNRIQWFKHILERHAKNQRGEGNGAFVAFVATDSCIVICTALLVYTPAPTHGSGTGLTRQKRLPTIEKNIFQQKSTYSWAYGNVPDGRVESPTPPPPNRVFVRSICLKRFPSPIPLLVEKFGSESLVIVRKSCQNPLATVGRCERPAQASSIPF